MDGSRLFFQLSRSPPSSHDGALRTDHQDPLERFHRLLSSSPSSRPSSWWRHQPANGLGVDQARDNLHACGDGPSKPHHPPSRRTSDTLIMLLWLDPGGFNLPLASRLADLTSVSTSWDDDINSLPSAKPDTSPAGCPQPLGIHQSIIVTRSARAGKWFSQSHSRRPSLPF